MQQIATITSKRQLTIPVEIFRQLGLVEGERVMISEKDGKIMIHPAKDLVEDLAGSVEVPRRYRGLPMEKIIRLAKKEYFKNKR